MGSARLALADENGVAPLVRRRHDRQGPQVRTVSVPPVASEMSAGRQCHASKVQSAFAKQTSEHCIVVVSQKLDAHWKSLVQRLHSAPAPSPDVHAAMMSLLRIAG